MTSGFFKQFVSKLLYIINLILVVTSFYGFALLTGKFYIKKNNYSVSGTIFQYTGQLKGYFLSLIEKNDFKTAETLAGKKNDAELNGILYWGKNDYPKAIEKFIQCSNDFFLSYAYYKNNELDKALQAATKSGNLDVISHINVGALKFNESVKHFLDTRNNLGFFNVFLEIGNFPTSIYYLLKSGDIIATTIANLILSNKITLPELNLELSNNDIANWIYFLKGDFSPVEKFPWYNSQTEIQSIINYINGSPETLLKSNSLIISTFVNTLIPDYQKKSCEKESLELSKTFPQLEIYSIVPDKVYAEELNKNYLIFFAIGLSILISIFIASLYYLYRKYKLSLEIQRQKDLEKMDALSIAKHEQMEAKKKRDKTELNVSSFVTLNIQMEVLDLAYTKLGLRVNPAKLTEQLEKTKIPNISFKIYTISNSYGLNVKMLSTTPQELTKQTQAGVVVLVLKGDLIALLKSADTQNAYLQFSQKDSRKVPYTSLKLSWDGNIILLNKI